MRTDKDIKQNRAEQNRAVPKRIVFSSLPSLHSLQKPKPFFTFSTTNLLCIHFNTRYCHNPQSTMETLKNLNKLWRTSALLPSVTTHSDAAAVNVDDEEVKVIEEEEEDEEESFIELELVMLNSKTKDKESEFLPPTVNVGSSPVSILKSAPKFKVSLFRKSGDSNSPDLKLKQRPNSKIDDEEKENVSSSTISTLIRENSRANSPVTKQSTSKSKPENDDGDSVSSKRFSKDVMHKYLKLKLIKPFHLKVAKRSASMNNTKSSSSSSSRLFELKNFVSSPASTPSTSSSSSSSGFGLRVVCKQLGKSRSASSMTVCNRRDEWLKVEHDDDGGIQSAILHCKRSFNSSRDSSVHSRSSSDSNSRE